LRFFRKFPSHVLTYYAIRLHMLTNAIPSVDLAEDLIALVRAYLK
jgi:hypothetical protein